jgi:predicted acetyltransferase
LVLAVDEQGHDRGYIHYEVKKETLTIHELVYDSIETYHTLWRHVADHDSMATTYTGFVRADDPLTFLLDDPRIKQEIQPYFMARIIDVEALLARIPFAPPAASGAAPTPESPEAPALAVTALDPWAPWNEKTFTVAIDPVQGRRIAAHAIAADHIRSLDDVHIQCTIQTLSAMLFGYKRPRLLHALGLITRTEAAVAAWEQALPERVTHLMDFF